MFAISYFYNIAGSVKFTGTRVFASIVIGEIEIEIIDQFVVKFLECALDG